MVSLLALHSLKKKFFKFENVVEFDFTLMNIFMLMKEKYESYSCYCYCDKYKDCCCYPLFKMLFRERLLCSMCRLQSFYFSKNAVDGMCVNEFLDIYSNNFQKLKQLAEVMWPFFKKVFIADRKCLEFFDDEYHSIHKDWNDPDCYGSLSLREIVDYDKYLIKSSDPPERYYESHNPKTV